MQSRNEIRKLRAPSTKKSQTGLEFRKNPRPGPDWSKIIDKKINRSESVRGTKINNTKDEGSPLKEAEL
jgi:hypothetical protein